VGTEPGFQAYYLGRDTVTSPADTITQFPLSQRVVWLRYLERTREAGDDYAEVEEAAWDELQKALTRVPGSPEDAA
jgi:hypothetical protein